MNVDFYLIVGNKRILIILHVKIDNVVIVLNLLRIKLVEVIYQNVDTMVIINVLMNKMNVMIMLILLEKLVEK